MIINVTQDDIDKGVPLSPCRCPLARALRRQWLPSAVVTAETAMSSFKGEVRVPLPAAALWFELVVDRGPRAALRPFSFELPVPSA